MQSVHLQVFGSSDSANMPYFMANQIMPGHTELCVIPASNIPSILQAAIQYRNRTRSNEFDTIAIEQFMQLMLSAKKAESPVRCIPFTQRREEGNTNGAFSPMMEIVLAE